MKIVVMISVKIAVVKVMMVVKVVMMVVGFNYHLSFQNCRFTYLLQKLIFRKSFVIKI